MIFDLFHNKIARQEWKALMLFGDTYRNISTVCVTPTLGMISAIAVESWINMRTILNQKYKHIFVEGDEVATAYNRAITQILQDSELSTYHYILFLEDDIVVDPDSFIKLVKGIGSYDALVAPYMTKSGTSMTIYGQDGMSIVPEPGIHPVYAFAMGFSLVNMDVFRRVEYPWFVTDDLNKVTQDIAFAKKFREAGFRSAYDGDNEVGHYDKEHKTLL